MRSLLNSIENQLEAGGTVPFSVYSSTYEQRLLNVPIAKPLLILVLKGDKELGNKNEILCPAGSFIFLSDSPAINMRNIPENNTYFALLIEFEYEDFQNIPTNNELLQEYFIGETVPALLNCVQQFVESSAWAPKEIVEMRRKEILTLLCVLGYDTVGAMMVKSKISYQLHNLFLNNNFTETSIEFICNKLAMSESTLRRKLKLEGASVQEIKDRAKLGLALHLLQTSSSTIGLIAQKCGYSSQSRFTSRFKRHFGLTPSELRRTKMVD